MLWKLSTLLFVLGILSHVCWQMFQVLWKMWVQLCTVEAPGLFQIHVIWEWEYCVNGEMKPDCQPVETSYFIFYGKIAAWPISHTMKTPVGGMLSGKTFRMKISRIINEIIWYLSFLWLILFSIMTSRSFYVFIHGRISSFYMAE